MNRQFTYQQIVQGYLIATEARHLSEHTISDYNNSFRKFGEYIGADKPFNEITTRHVELYIGGYTDVTNTTLLHYYSALSVLWAWAVKEKVVDTNIIQAITPPRPEEREIVPFNEGEFKSMLSVITRSRAYVRPGKTKSDHAVTNPERSRAILLVLLDTGLRIGELVNIKMHQLDQRNYQIRRVFGKRSRERSVPFSSRTAQALWRYLATRNNPEPDDYLFVTYNNRRIDPSSIAKSLKWIGEKAGVQNVHPHRFRHTFAIQYLRNGGDPYTLQRLLGHSSLDMVKRYLALAQVDLDRAHKRASPVDNWTL